MGFLKSLSNKNVPEELPDLVIDEIKEKLNEPSEKPRTNFKEDKKESKLKPASQDYSESKGTKVSDTYKTEERLVDKDKSFFNSLLSDINNEINDLGKLEGWYNNKFVNNDIVTDMKDYWQDKKHELVIKSIGKGFKEKINEKVGALQNLEAEWQDIYLRLIEKEEELKKEEQELKKIVSEFMEMCKRRGTITDETPVEKKE